MLPPKPEEHWRGATASTKTVFAGGRARFDEKEESCLVYVDLGAIDPNLTALCRDLNCRFLVQ